MKIKRGIYAGATKCLVFSLLFWAVAASVPAESADTVVVYPHVREPFAALYRDYLAGIHSVLSSPSRDFEVNGEGQEALTRALAESPPEVIIALGNKSLGIVSSIKGEQPLVGLVANRDYEETLAGGILLRPSAAVYLENLLAIHRNLRHLYVVYNPDQDRTLVEEAAALVEEKGITLIARKAHTVREAAAEYRQLLGTGPAHAAIWLLTDHGFLDSAMLSSILDVAWERKLIVFSSNPLVVKHGALFAVYPDNRGVGRTVAEIALEVAQGSRQPLQPLRDVRLAVNERTLNHLGLPLTPEVRERIELMLPGR